jgi:hypothetical protein
MILQKLGNLLRTLNTNMRRHKIQRRIHSTHNPTTRNDPQPTQSHILASANALATHVALLEREAAFPRARAAALLTGSEIFRFREHERVRFDGVQIVVGVRVDVFGDEIEPRVVDYVAHVLHYIGAVWMGCVSQDSLGTQQCPVSWLTIGVAGGGGLTQLFELNVRVRVGCG